MTACWCLGLAHVVGNKGGLIVRCEDTSASIGSLLAAYRFQCLGTSLAFISCHLAAHEGESHRKDRNDNCAEVLEGARVAYKKADVSHLPAALNLCLPADCTTLMVWFGLCMRTDAPLSDHHAPRCLHRLITWFGWET